MKSYSIVVLIMYILLIALETTAQPPSMRLRPGGGIVEAIRIAGDGHSLVSASFDGTIVRWNLVSGKPIWRIKIAKAKSHKSTPTEVLSMDLSPSGKIVAVAFETSGEVGIAVVSVENGRIQKTLLGHSSDVMNLSFGRTDHDLVSVANDHTARVWDVETGKETLQIHLRESGKLARFSPDGASVAIATQPIWGLPPQPIVALFDRSSGRSLREFPRTYNDVCALDFTHDNLIICGYNSPNSQTSAWNLRKNDATPENLPSFGGGNLFRMAISPARDTSAIVRITTKTMLEVRTFPGGNLLWSRELRDDPFSMDIGSNGLVAIGNSSGEVLIFKSE